MPAASAEEVQVATPLPFKAAEGDGEPTPEKVTLPVGVALPEAPLTVAVNVSDWPA